jgi:integrase
VAVYKQRTSKYWSYKFTWNGKLIRKSTKQANKRVAEQMEAAHRTALAKGEVGIVEKKPVPTLKEFAERDFLPFVKTQFAEKPATISYYRSGIAHLTGFAALANTVIDQITIAHIGAFIEKDRQSKYKVATINRHLQILRRMLRLAVEWGKVEKVPPRISLLPGEHRRDRVLSPAEETAYLAAATQIGNSILESYSRALDGIRATQRGQIPQEPTDPYLLRDVAIVLLECGLRPEECYRLRWENVRDGAVHIPFGKTQNARRLVPLSPKANAILEMRHAAKKSDWVFAAPTRSGHIGQSTLKKRHAQACKNAKLPHFPPYTFRHTCITRWAAHMDPYTLADVAGHGDFGTTKRYVHPQAETVRAAMQRAQGGPAGHTSGHTRTDRVDEDPLQISGKGLEIKGLEWYARVDSNHWPFAPEANALSS